MFWVYSKLNLLIRSICTYALSEPSEHKITLFLLSRDLQGTETCHSIWQLAESGENPSSICSPLFLIPFLLEALHLADNWLQKSRENLGQHTGGHLERLDRRPAHLHKPSSWLWDLQNFIPSPCLPARQPRPLYVHRANGNQKRRWEEYDLATRFRAENESGADERLYHRVLGSRAGNLKYRRWILEMR